MNSPNILQKLYLARALNEDATKIFEHPKQLDESYTQRKQYGRKPPTPEQAEARKANAAKWVKGRKKTHKLVDSPSGKKKIWVPKDQTNEAWEAGFQTYREAHREVQDSLRADAKKKRLHTLSLLTKVHRGEMTPAQFTKAHKKAGGFSTYKEIMSTPYWSKKMAKVSKKPRTPKPMSEETLAEGSRGQARLGRMMKSLVRNQRQGKEIIGKRPEHYNVRALVSPNDPEVKKYHEDLRAGVAHMKKKDALRRQINARTRAAAMRERMKAGLNPELKLRDTLSPSIPSPAHQGKPINVTGGYEHQENPKRIPKAIQKYRQSSWRKMMRQGK